MQTWIRYIVIKGHFSLGFREYDGKLLMCVKLGYFLTI